MKQKSPIFIFVLLAFSIACVATVDRDRDAAANADHAVADANKASARAYIDRLVNQGDMAAWPELIAGDTLTFNGRPMSADDMAGMRNTFHSILEGMHVEIVDQIAEGDVVASRVTITGKHLGDYMGLKASGKDVSFSGIAYDRFADGKLAESWHEMDIWGTLLMASDD